MEMDKRILESLQETIPLDQDLAPVFLAQPFHSAHKLNLIHSFQMSLDKEPLSQAELQLINCSQLDLEQVLL